MAGSAARERVGGSLARSLSSAARGFQRAQSDNAASRLAGGVAAVCSAPASDLAERKWAKGGGQGPPTTHRPSTCDRCADNFLLAFSGAGGDCRPAEPPPPPHIEPGVLGTAHPAALPMPARARCLAGRPGSTGGGAHVADNLQTHNKSKVGKWPMQTSSLSSDVAILHRPQMAAMHRQTARLRRDL